MGEYATDGSADAAEKLHHNGELHRLELELKRADMEINEICAVPDLTALPPLMDKICHVQDSEDLTQELRLFGDVNNVKSNLEKEDPEGDVRINVRSNHGVKRRAPSHENDSPRTKKRKMKEVAKLSAKRARGTDQRKLNKLEEVKHAFYTGFKELREESDGESDMAPFMRMFERSEQARAEEAAEARRSRAEDAAEARRTQLVMLQLLAQIVPQAAPVVNEEEKQNEETEHVSGHEICDLEVSDNLMCAALEKETAPDQERVSNQEISELLAPTSDDDLSDLELSSDQEGEELNMVD